MALGTIVSSYIIILICIILLLYNPSSQSTLLACYNAPLFYSSHQSLSGAGLRSLVLRHRLFIFLQHLQFETIKTDQTP